MTEDKFGGNMAKFIARYDKLLFSISLSITMIGYMFNSNKAFLNMHVSNSIFAISLLLISLSVVIKEKLQKRRWLVVIASFITSFEILGYIALARVNGLLIADTSFWVILASIIPCFFNLLLFGSIAWNTTDSNNAVGH